MPVLPLDRHLSLDELIAECALARSSARDAIVRSTGLLDRLATTQRRVTAARLASRQRTHYARVTGVVDGAPVTAVVRRDGSVSGDRRLLQRAEVVVKLGDTFDGGRVPASSGRDPLASTLTMTRACDRVLAVAVYDASSRPDVPQVEAVGSISHPAAGRGALPGGAIRLRPRRSAYPADADPLDPTTLFGVSLSTSEGAQVVCLSGELDLAYRDQLETALGSAVRSNKDVVVDVARLIFIDAAGLSALVAAREQVSSFGHRFVVRGAQGIVRRVFGVCQLDHLLDD